ncbi:MAG: hypothetical protein EOS79_33510, partial [Mesorhizobium sp.]
CVALITFIERPTNADQSDYRHAAGAWPLRHGNCFPGTQSEARGLEHGEWLAMLLEREATMRRQKRFEARAKAAKLRHDAQIENADFRAA